MRAAAWIVVVFATTGCEGGGSATECGPGFAASGPVCVDVDECATGTAACHRDATCTNTEGGYTCACKAGYSGDGETCADVDECATNNGGCDPLTTCTNTLGGRACGNCPSGYSGSGDAGCTDVDECATNNGGCGANRVCTNNPGAPPTCTCQRGYQEVTICKATWLVTAASFIGDQLRLALPRADAALSDPTQPPFHFASGSPEGLVSIGYTFELSGLTETVVSLFAPTTTDRYNIELAGPYPEDEGVGILRYPCAAHCEAN
jgi:hypothetical protein